MSYTPPPPPSDPSGQGGPTDPSGATPPGYDAPPPPGGYGYGAPPSYQPPKSSGRAVAALVIGIASTVLGLCCAFFGLVGIAAIVLGRSAKDQIIMSGGRLTGTGMAQAGIVLGIVGCAIGLIMTVVNIFLITSGTFEVNTSP